MSPLVMAFLSGIFDLLMTCLPFCLLPDYKVLSVKQLDSMLKKVKGYLVNVWAFLWSVIWSIICTNFLRADPRRCMRYEACFICHLCYVPKNHVDLSNQICSIWLTFVMFLSQSKIE